MRVFVVEDESSSLTAMVSILQKWGYDVTGFESGREAIECAQRHPPDILVCDWLLQSNLDGVDVARQLREHNPAMHIVLITGLPIEQLEDRMQGFSVAAVLPKPLDLARLDAALESTRSGKSDDG